MSEAFVAAQVASTSQAGAALRQISVREAAGDGVLAGLVKERQALQDRYRRVQTSLMAPSADRVALAGEGDELAAQIAALDRRIAAEYPDFSALTKPAALSVADVQAVLRPDEALVLTFTGEETTFVWAISKQRAGWLSVAAGQPLLDQVVSELRLGLDPSAVTRGAAALDDAEAPASGRTGFRRDLAERLYGYLLRPLEPVIGPAGTLYVVTDGPLTSLPFSVLVTEPPVGEDDDPAALRATKWLIRDHALVTLPSVDSLRLIRSLPPLPSSPREFLGFGDPALEGGTTLAALSRGAGVMRSGMADVTQLRALPPLPQTRTELLTIAATLGAPESDVRLGPTASEGAVKSMDLKSARVLAFATHGLLSGELEGLTEPALVMSPPDRPSRADDGLLTASEISSLTLSADWVLLSACNTAGGDGPGAEGLSGLARAFLFAGARSILVSHWPVRDDAAARLTTDTFRALTEGRAETKAQALRLAMLGLMEDPRDPSLAAPSAWAPFVLVGDGG
ncbi:CHAT domain-containing protein [Neotabrizicola shimadae]|uniref:CHAT domain-containing protein n=1 Tax=Neotabrizicola shimadae TaxID=2807096 RepID=A0A8G1EBV2_9RHOB|nr:CHAT domain-containing protein [Neotabrizicola shimadae]QYZ69792.1 CHAT domain-containing protein [Neotabrizicola shimadae]